MTLWYLARAAGVMALVLFTVAASLGALGAGSAKPEQRFWLQYVHRSAAVTGLIVLAAHITAVITDSYVSVSTSVLVVPFSSSYRPFAVTVGVLAMYGLVLAAVVGAARGRLARSEAFTKRWRVIHIAASVGWLLSIGHSLLAGTDRGTPWMLAITLGCVAAVASSVAVRMRSRAVQARTPLSLARAGRIR
jgi:sulfoxide reductase heme-binding subunit YedZ